MGFFDFFKKKSAPRPPQDTTPQIQVSVEVHTPEERNAAELAEIKAYHEDLERKHTRNLSDIDWSVMLPGDQPVSISAVETDFLGYVDGLHTDGTKIAKRWTEAGIDFQSVLRKFFSMGLVEWASVESTLHRMKGADLKSFLQNRGMPTSGKKSVLVERILAVDSEELRSLFPATSISVTEQGRLLVEQKRKQDRDNAFHQASVDASTHLAEGNLGAYTIDLLHQTEVLCAEGNYKAALTVSLLRFCVDVSGISDLEQVRQAKENPVMKGRFKPLPTIVPHTIRTIVDCREDLGLDDKQFKDFFFSEIGDEQIPFGVCSAKECYSLLTMALEDQEAACQEAKKYARRFVRREGL